MLMQQISDHVMDQRSGRQGGLIFDVGVQSDGARGSVVRSRQTAESFARAAASATAAATFF